MRKVFSTSDQLIHIWAQQNQDEGRAGNVHFDGRTLYSYSTPIAYFMSHVEHTDNGTYLETPSKLCVLHTTATYSVTTTRHQNDAKSATRQYRQFSVPNIGIGGGRSYNRNYCGDMHVENMQAYIDKYFSMQAKAYASATQMESYIGQCNRIINEAEQYATFFDAAFDIASFPCMDEVKLQKARGRSERACIKAEAKQVAQDTWRNASVTEQVRMFLAGETTQLPYNWKTAIDAAAILEVQDRLISLWRSGSIRDCETDYTMLRLQGETIHTSQGAQFPASDAILAWQYIKRIYAAGIAWARNGETIRLGSFQIDSIDSDGKIHAGCHTVERQEIELMANTLGLLQEVTL